jgi:hypothetical protein
MPMERIAGDELSGTYRGSIVGQPTGTLVRWRVKAENQAGVERFNPSPTEREPTPIPTQPWSIQIQRGLVSPT